MAYEGRISQPDRGLRVLAQGPAGRHGQNAKVSEHSPGAKGWGRAPRRLELEGLVGEQPKAFQLPAAGTGDAAVAKLKRWRGFHVMKNGNYFRH